MLIVHYEVYVLEARGWMLHARFPRQERDEAIKEAKELESTLAARVKVLRESYVTDTNSFEEAEIYISGGGVIPEKPIKPVPAGPAAGTSAAPRAGGTYPAGLSRPAAAKSTYPSRPRRGSAPETAKAHQLLGRLLAITAASLAVALLAIRLTPHVILTLWEMGFRLDVSPQNYGQLLFLIFVIAFIGTALPLAVRFLPRNTELPVFRKSAPAGGASRTPADPELKRSLRKLSDQALQEQEAEKKKEKEKEKEKEEEEAEADVELPELPDVEELPPAPDDTKSAKDAEKESEETAEGIATELAVMRDFSSGAMSTMRGAVPSMDAYNKFALHLYLAGGVEALCQRRSLKAASRDKIMCATLEALGTRGDLARKFVHTLDEYIREERYAQMVQAGRAAMTCFLNGDEMGAHIAVKTAMQDWNKPKDGRPSLITVMFTDMVGSTDLTQARGDMAAQEIVRRHNAIVRAALMQFGGREIKHTGDGIMASFISAPSAVEAAISIQRQVFAHNERLPDQALHLRIGLNTGEPIQEEDDLFGTTVQLAARVCAATNTDSILCAPSTQSLSSGRGLTFISRGPHTLKGFKDTIELFEVIWEEPENAKTP